MPSAAQVILQLQNQAAPQIAATASATKQLTAEEQRAQQASLSRAQAIARLQVALGQTAQAERTLAAQIAQSVGQDNAVIRAETQLASVRQRVARETAAEEAALRKQQDALRAAVQPITAVGAASQQSSGYVAQFTAGLVGFAAPAAVANAVLGAVVGTANSFKEAFTFKAQLDQTTASIGLQLRGIRDSGQAFREASAFADRYKLTQEETTGAIQASVPLLRQSRASLTDVEGTLLRLSILKPEQGIQGAAFALAELAGGQTKSLETRFNIPIAKANELKKEIEGGGDAIQVVSKYLTEAGIGMDALDVRTKGAAGALNDAARAAERLKIAQAQFAQGPGIAILNTETRTLNNLTGILSGNFRVLFKPATQDALMFAGGQRGAAYATKLHTQATEQQAQAAQRLGVAESLVTTGLVNQENRFVNLIALKQQDRNASDQITAAMQAYTAGNQQAADGILHLNDGIQQSAVQSQLDTAQKASQAKQTQVLQAQTQLAADSFLRLNPGITESGIAAQVAAGRIPGYVGELAAIQVQASASADELIRLSNVANQAATDKVTATNRFFGRASGRGGGSDAQAESDAFVSSLQKQNDAQNKLRDSQIALAAARRQTGREIGLLQQKQAQYAAGSAEYNQIEAQIISLRTSTDKAHTTELGKQLTLQEGIRDSLEAQYKAQLDADELAIKDRQDRRKEDQKIAADQRVLASGRASAAFKGAAADDLALIAIDRQKRQLEIADKSATAGGTIVNGRVLQSIQRGGGSGLPAIPTGAGGAAVGAPAGPAAGGLGGTEINVYLDSEQIAARIEVRQRQGLRRTIAAGGGRG